MRSALAAMALALCAALGGAHAQDESAPAAPEATVEAPRLQLSQPIPAAELEAFVDGFVMPSMLENHIAGVTVAVVQDGQVVLKKGYGFASFDPVRRVDPDKTLFRIGSITKTFTWITLMNGVESGRIRLDEPVNTYLPEELHIPKQGFGQPILVRDLLTHSPGFEDRAVGVLFVDDAAKLRPLNQFLREERPARVREPGVLSSYSNYGVALAGAAVAHVESTPWQDLVEHEILTPLGMANTSTREPYPAREDLPAPMPADLAADNSLPFAWNGIDYEARKYEHITQIAPAGVMSSSASDMARYMLMLLGDGTLDGTTIFGPGAAKAFRTPMLDYPDTAGNLDAGFFESPLPGGFTGYGHNGATLSFFSNMIVVPKLRLGVFVSTNTQGGGQISGPLPSLVVGHFYGPPQKPADAAVKSLVAEAPNYAGQYLPTRRAYSGLEGFAGRLRAINVAVSPNGYLLLTLQTPSTRFVPTDKPGEFESAEGNGTLKFEMANGKATRIVGPGLSADRLGPLYQTTTLMTVAALALLAGATTIIGLFVRFGRSMHSSLAQTAGSHLQTLSSLALFVAICAVLLFVTTPALISNVVYTWPGPYVLTFSYALLSVAVMTLTTLVLLPGIWGAAAGDEGWSVWRKLRFTMTALIFAGLSVLLGLWGALEPWRP